jgi:hypothetical protein
VPIIILRGVSQLVFGGGGITYAHYTYLFFARRSRT